MAATKKKTKVKFVTDREYYTNKLIEAREDLEKAQADLEKIARAGNKVSALQALVDTYEAILRDLTARKK